MTENLSLICLIKEMFFSFISIACPILIAIYHEHITRATTDLINKLVNARFLLISMEKQHSKCTRIISLLKKIFEKHFTAYEFIKFFYVQLFLHISMCMYTFTCIYFIHVYFICLICLYVYMLLPLFSLAVVR